MTTIMINTDKVKLGSMDYREQTILMAIKSLIAQPGDIFDDVDKLVKKFGNVFEGVSTIELVNNIQRRELKDDPNYLPNEIKEALNETGCDQLFQNLVNQTRNNGRCSLSKLLDSSEGWDLDSLFKALSLFSDSKLVDLYVNSYADNHGRISYNVYAILNERADNLYQKDEVYTHVPSILKNSMLIDVNVAAYIMNLNTNK